MLISVNVILVGRVSPVKNYHVKFWDFVQVCVFVVVYGVTFLMTVGFVVFVAFIPRRCC